MPTNKRKHVVPTKRVPTKAKPKITTKAKPKITTTATTKATDRRVSFGTGTTSPNNTIVQLNDGKTSARDGINPTPVSTSHLL